MGRYRWKFSQKLGYLLNCHILRYFSLCVVTTFCIPIPKHLIEGRELLGMWSMRVSSESLLDFLIWTTPYESLEEFDTLFSSIMHLEKTSPVSWFKNRSTPSIPPTTNVDLSPRKWCIEYMTFGLTLMFHKVLIVLQDNRMSCTSFFWSANVMQIKMKSSSGYTIFWTSCFLDFYTINLHFIL